MEDTRLDQAQQLFKEGRKLLAEIIHETPQLQAHAWLTRSCKCVTSAIGNVDKVKQLHDGDAA